MPRTSARLPLIKHRSCCQLPHNGSAATRASAPTDAPPPSPLCPAAAAYLGAANAGIPLSMVVQATGWNGFFTALMGACAVAFALLATVSNAPSYLQRQEKAVAKPALA